MTHKMCQYPPSSFKLEEIAGAHICRDQEEWMVGRPVVERLFWTRVLLRVRKRRGRAEGEQMEREAQ